MLHTLNVAQTGLKVSQTQVENVSNNIANENVDGYKKRVVNISELGHDDARRTGRGVWIDNVARTTDIYLYKNIVTQEGRLNSIKELNSMLGDMESIFDETDDAGLSAELNRYFESIENLRTTPQDEIYKNDLLNSATSVVQSLKKLYGDIEAKEESLLSEANDLVDRVNTILKEIGNISDKIFHSTTDRNDLLDKRDTLELELAQYIDVEISDDSNPDNYELIVAGITAVKFNTNIHEIKLIENYTPQQDIYAATDPVTGATLTTGINGDFISSFPSFTGAAAIAEVQTIDINGLVDDGSGDAVGTAKTIQFLGYTVPTQMGDDGIAVATDINAQSANIITNWNLYHPDQEIASLTVAGNQVTITYAQFEGDVPAIGNSSSTGIDFTGSIETTKGDTESLTYILDNSHQMTVTIGETIVDSLGVPVDFDASGGGGVVTQNNIIQALVYRINQDKDIGGTVTAYNGKYELDQNGHKILTSDIRHSKYQNPALGVNAPGHDDRYLFIEAVVDGEAGSFVGELLVNDNNSRQYIDINETFSKEGIDDIHLEIYDKEVEVNSGSLSSILNNIKTDSGSNLFKEYKEKLNLFAQKLSDYTDSFIETGSETYIFGTDAVNIDYDADKAIFLNLFSGASVKTLQFHANNIHDLSQEDLDYLAEIQWKTDIDFDGTGENNQSFSEYFQTLRVKVADDRETIIFNQEAQEAVKESLQTTYDKLTKVDSDEEMVSLIKFQAAYEANAKIITTIDEMLQVLLGLKR